jgi:ceramide glucosyltransferase
VGVAPDYLRKVISELQKPDAGLVTWVYHGLADPGFWPRLSAKATNYQFLPGVVTGLALGLARPCFGQTTAMRREMFRLVASFAAVGLAGMPATFANLRSRMDRCEKWRRSGCRIG